MDFEEIGFNGRSLRNKFSFLYKNAISFEYFVEILKHGRNFKNKYIFACSKILEFNLKELLNHEKSSKRNALQTDFCK